MVTHCCYYDHCEIVKLVLLNVIVLKPCCANCEGIVTVISAIDRQDRVTKRNETDLIQLFQMYVGNASRWYLNCKHNHSSRRFANLELSTYNYEQNRH